jgi:putative NADH-flavin reductase
VEPPDGASGGLVKLVIFGATGGTGQQLVDQSLAAGHEVVAFVRDPAKLDIRHEHLMIVQGDVTDPAAVERAIAGVDAVISALNTRRNAKGRPITVGTRHILAAMKKHGVRRLVFSAAPSARDPQDTPDLRYRMMISLVRLVARSAYEDMVDSVQAVRASDTDWTIVRLAFPTDGPATGWVRAGFVNKETGTRISRADAAAFMLREMQQAAYLRQAPVISN